MTDLLAMPDDALVRVLALLPPREVFRLRLVCRRLRDLSLHPDVWRSVSLRGGDQGLLQAALRLAPCLRKVSLRSPHLQAAACTVCNSKCVVTDLKLSVQNETDAAWATAIVQRLSTLGGLREITLLLNPAAPDALHPLLRMVYCVQDLRVLRIRINSDMSELPPLLSDLEPRPSLTTLHYEGAASDPFLCFLLRTHAATLEDVDLYLKDGLPTSLLKSLPRLRSLTCFPTDDLSQLKSLPNLETLGLLDLEVQDAPCPGTVDFLLQGPRLRHVEFHLKPNRPIVGAALLEALAQSPSAPVLERLSLKGVGEWPVAAALHRFPSLQALALVLDAMPSDDFFRAVSPASTPRLATLQLVPHGCPHAWLHDPAVQDVLARNAGLHLRLSGPPTLEDDCACRWCLWRCHRDELRTHAGLQSAFSAHTRRPGCPRDCRRWL
ncbi:uncharacterized protein LOC117654243 isoform X2 [Thrips palmi]|uniref:Uncharacterized protein LOC117654243 isoform X2 n=1 Tax=Thrips palmi TaxID=161013 RepID=A0A6P9ADX0_THRPL|nr:uncharacterized protein LOC117654243 isoform X2 [Thrips palmi]XP_034256460.1 uncharacterized protein LOC117654243 isoform X2 [Thrips palmi]XP_034256461.1 uncharacterized protein LOC117654243 isoform X2 [Thrips palmi]XP_034256462.1 uncharacterized protein LOC117654243 isoform X2 [Thrips palmi]XP_034256463.1 uncharacterized protein LOC117654243 isoform X2 [Thrips palmi]XP_034256464.1 uncharacterized protein LOC117654243 isoform X2 [Thrips palmi]XP_034256465.1 uncharacterized protein LOC11765